MPISEMRMLLWGVATLWWTFSCYDEVESFGLIQTELDLWVTVDDSNLPLHTACLKYTYWEQPVYLDHTYNFIKIPPTDPGQVSLNSPLHLSFFFIFFRNSECSEIWNKCKGRYVDVNIHPGCMPYVFLLSHLFHPSFLHNCWPLGKRKG